MEIIYDTGSYPVKELLHILLKNRHTKWDKIGNIEKYAFFWKGIILFRILFMDKQEKKNIVWNTKEYTYLGEGYEENSSITEELLLENRGFTLKSSVCKTKEEIRKHFIKYNEIMTPIKDYLPMVIDNDEHMFGKKDAFIRINDDGTWTASENKVDFGKTSWRRYVNNIIVNEYHYDAFPCVTRYDDTTGEMINPPKRRIGSLDRRLRVVGENTKTEREWIKWAKKAVFSFSGADYQGDEILIARIDILMTFYEHYIERFGKEPDIKTLEMIANIISKNIWQIKDFDD